MQITQIAIILQLNCCSITDSFLYKTYLFGRDNAPRALVYLHLTRLRELGIVNNLFTKNLYIIYM